MSYKGWAGVLPALIAGYFLGLIVGLQIGYVQYSRDLDQVKRQISTLASRLDDVYTITTANASAQAGMD